MKHFVARRVAPVALVGILVTSGLFATSTPANAGIVDDCKAAFQTFLDFFRAVDTAAHHEQAPDGLISQNDVRATASGRADIVHLPDNQQNLNTYYALMRAGDLISRQTSRNNVMLVMDELDIAARRGARDGLISAADLQAAIANPGAICG
jgi:hypothetical protein